MFNKSLLASFIVMAMLVSPVTAKAGEVWLTTDQVRSYKLKKPVANIVVGNSEIADVTVRASDEIFLLGRRTGLTNVYFYDQEGNELDNIFIRVKSPSKNMVTLTRGVEAETTYSCTDKCEDTAIAAAQ